MKKIIFLIFFATSIFAQNFEQLGWDSKFGAAVGYSPMYLFPNTDKFNEKLGNIGFSEIADDGIFASGFSGNIYIMVLPDVRVGGFGYSGKTSQNKSLNGIGLEAQYEISGAGISFEYTLPIIRKAALSVGFLLGTGEVNFNIYKNNNDFDWDEIWRKIEENESSLDYSRNLSDNFYIFAPMLNLDFPISRFLAFRFGLGYQFSFDNEWKIENGKDIKNFPDINGDAFFVQSGIYLGFFAF